MKFEFEVEEGKDNFTLEEVQAIVSDFEKLAGETIKEKDETITGLTTQVEGIEKLEGANHELQVQNLAIQNGIGEDLFDLIQDDDIEVVKTKIELVKNIKKSNDTENTFKPEKKRSEDGYEKAINEKDVEGALKNKFSRMFG